MSRVRGLGEPIPEEKLRGLRAALERDHYVRFKNGSLVEFEDCRTCDGEGALPAVVVNGAQISDPRECPTCGGEKVRLLVTRPAGGVARYRLDTELRSAYAMALRGPQPKRGITGRLPSAEAAAAKFGDEAPW